MIRLSRIVSFVLLISIALSLVVVQCIPGSIEASAESNFDDGQLIIVSLGDSYSSGEGIEPFYGQDKEFKERIKDDNWLAHRSELSWAGRIHIEGMPEGTTLSDYNVDAGKADKNSSIQWYFRASSGAETKHLNNEKHEKPVKRWGISLEDISVVYPNAILPKMKAYTLRPIKKLPTQLSVIDEYSLKGKVDYVTVTIGGNDVDFAGIITQCAKEPSYLTGGIFLKYKLFKLWYGSKKDKIDNIDQTREKIRQAYKDIEEKVGKQATIIVAGYPKLLDADGKGALFSKQEAAIINCAVTKFNYIINSVVKECREKEDMNIIFVDVEEKFDTKDNNLRRHQAYSGDAWIGPIMVVQNQDLDHSNPISGYSMHPNKKGVAAYAECVNNAIWKNDSTGHWHESTDYDFEYNKSKLNDMFKEIIDGQNRTKAEKYNDKVCFSPHSYGEWITEASTGKKYRKCTVCGYEDVADPGHGGVDPNLVGDWYDEDGEKMTIEDSGYATYSNNYNFTVSTEKGKLTWQRHGGSITYDYKITDGVLTISGGGEPTMVFYRKKQSDNRYIDKELIGDWYDDKGVLRYTFRNDGTVYDSKDYGEANFVIESGNTIVIFDEGTAVDYTYKIYNDVLTLTGYGGSAERYYRSPKGVTPPGGGGGGGGSGGGSGGGGGSVEGDWVVVDSGRVVEGLLVTFRNGKETINAGSDSVSYSYRINGDLLTVTHEHSDSVYRFKVSGDRMYFYSPDDGELWITFKRK